MSSEINELKTALRVLADCPGWDARKALTAMCTVAIEVLCSGGMVASRAPGLSTGFDLDCCPAFLGANGDDPNDDEAEAVARAGLAYVAAVAKAAPFTDIAFEVQDLFGSERARSGLGQHFTPPGLAQGALRFLPKNPKSDRQIVRMCDPTCGVGSMLLARIAQHYEQHGQEGVANLFVVANDIDPLCALLTATQIFANQIAHGVALGAVQVFVSDVIKDYVSGPGGKALHMSSLPGFPERIAAEELLHQFERRWSRLEQSPVVDTPLSPRLSALADMDERSKP